MSELNFTHSNGNKVKLTTPDTLAANRTLTVPGNADAQLASTVNSGIITATHFNTSSTTYEIDYLVVGGGGQGGDQHGGGGGAGGGYNASNGGAPGAYGGQGAGITGFSKTQGEVGQAAQKGTLVIIGGPDITVYGGKGGDGGSNSQDGTSGEAGNQGGGVGGKGRAAILSSGIEIAVSGNIDGSIV